MFFCINRNILECKVKYCLSSLSTSFFVLIETYWNVKDDVQLFMKRLRKGINRNILECKVCRVSLIKLDISVLIETYWNVKTESLNSSRVEVPY